ncbi:MAG: hypothetical protein ACI8W8_005030, partial [Rhodothermales bacterium]
MSLYDEAPRRTPWRVRIFRALVAATILALLTVITLILLLPSFALMGMDHFLDSAAIQDRDIAVRTVTMRATYLGPMRFGDEAGELSIEEVQLDHSIDGWKPQPGPIRVLGVKATLRQTEAGWQMDGLSDLMAWLAKQPPSDAPPPTVPKIQLRDATLDIIAGDYHEQVAIDATATAIATNAYRIVADFAIRGNTVELAADVDVSSGTVSAKWRSTIAIGSLEDLLPLPATGLLQLSGDLQTANWQPTMARVVLTESHLRASPGDASIATSSLRGMAEVARDESGALAVTQALLEGQLDHAVAGPWRVSGAKVSASVDAQDITLKVTQLAANGPDVAAKVDLEARSRIVGKGEPIPLQVNLALYDSEAYGWALPLTRLSVDGDSSALKLSVPEIRVARYANSAIRDFSADITLEPLSIAFRGDARLIPLEVLPAPVIGNEELYRAAFSGSASRADDGWSLAAQMQSQPQRVRVRIDDRTASGRLALAGKATWAPGSSSGQASFVLLKPSLATKKMVIAADTIGV